MRCFFRHGGMYQVCNSNLLFHASIPMNPDGTFKSVRILGQDYKGRALLDRVDPTDPYGLFQDRGAGRSGICA